MTVGSVSQGVNSLQFLRAQSAFKHDQKSCEKTDLSSKSSEDSIKVEISSKQINDKSNGTEKTEKADFWAHNGKWVEEIKKFAGKYNQTDFEDEDIKYAVQNGTSLLADYTA